MPEDSSNQSAPQWLVDWTLDLVDRMASGGLISLAEVEAWSRAMGHKMPTPEEADALLEDVFGMPADQAILKIIQNRHN